MENKIQGANPHSLTSSNSNVTTTQSLQNFQNYWQTDPYWVQPFWAQPYQPSHVYPWNYQPPQQLINQQHTLSNIPHVRPVLSAQPECYITVNGSRVKIYGANAYMPDNAEFELEIFNPSNETLGVKFKMYGKYIADSHLIIYPGKRITLDRFLNDNSKFKFQTYTIEDTTESKSAVTMNGAVQIEFYREQENNTVDLNKQLRVSPIPFCDGSFGQNPNTIFFNTGTGTCSTANGLYPGSTLTNTTHDDNSLVKGATAPIEQHDGINANYVHAGTFETPDCITTIDTTNNGPDVLCGNANTFNINDYMPDWLDTKSVKPADVETGMINKGGKSDTEFTEVDIMFELFCTMLKSYKILPLSQKPFEAKDLIRSCVKCNKKAKKEHSYCSNCGTKI